MRDRIIMAAIEEIKTKGFKFTMGDLAKRLSVSKSSLYECFSSKEKLVTAVLDTVLTNFCNQEQHIYQSELSIVEKLQAVLVVTSKTFEPFHNRVYDDLRTNYPDEWERVVLFRKERMERLTSLLNQGISEKIIRPVPIGVIQHMLLSTNFSNYQFLAENNITYPDAVAAMMDIMVHGLLTSNDK